MYMERKVWYIEWKETMKSKKGLRHIDRVYISQIIRFREKYACFSSSWKTWRLC